VAELENKFTWSASRANSFAYCDRQYWWTYYGSWGGWKSDAPREIREAYILKNLANRWTWAGTVVHEAIEGVLRRMQRSAGQGELPLGAVSVDPDVVIDTATALMRDQWVESRRGAYRQRPKKRFGLAEHEYDVVVPRAEWQATNQRVRDALRTFFTSDLWERIRASNSATWLPIETLDQFDFEGTGVWAVLDFAMRTPEGRIEIFDWKTGQVREDANKLQVGCYTLYVQSSRGVTPEEVTTHLVYLGEELQHFSYEMSEEDLVGVRAQMRASIAAMRARLRDGGPNVAVRDDFPLTDDLSKCETCAFRRLCDRA
jgi:CRISPR/Cas system-associated exonuclease Cas4 (RecB family)